MRALQPLPPAPTLTHSPPHRRLKAADALARAVEAGDAGRFSDAQRILQAAGRDVALSRTGAGSDRALADELRAASARVCSREAYASGGSAMVSGDEGGGRVWGGHGETA
jgi:hypothetical protein